MVLKVFSELYNMVSFGISTKCLMDLIHQTKILKECTTRVNNFDIELLMKFPQFSVT